MDKLNNARNWGGPRTGAGRKAGGQNRAPRPRIKKQVTFSPEEWADVEEQMGGLSFNTFARWSIFEKNIVP